jgi:hypothetical protein
MVQDKPQLFCYQNKMIFFKECQEAKNPLQTAENVKI